MKNRWIALILGIVMVIMIIPATTFASGDRDPALDDPFDGPVVNTTVSASVTEAVKVGKVKGLELHAVNIICTEVCLAPNVIDLTWNKVDGATFYKIYRTDGSSVIKYYKTVQSDSYYEELGKYYFADEVGTAKPAKTYTYQVVACKKVDGKTYYGEFSAAKKIVILAKYMTKVKRTSYKKSVKLSYKKVYGASRYVIKYSTKKNMKGAKTKVVKTLKTKISNLKSNKKYYFQVKAYRVYDGNKHYTKTRSFSINTKK